MWAAGNVSKTSGADLAAWMCGTQGGVDAQQPHTAEGVRAARFTGDLNHGLAGKVSKVNA